VKYVFGPVPSRRLGQSLGIDTIPLKTCNWNCVYCQLGRTQPLINQRKDYFPSGDILDEVRQALNAHAPGEIDWVTFVGSGEPTLHAHIGWLIREVKKLSELPVAVITNGSLLYLPEVRDELSVADAVLPTLDAGTPDLYRKINRPHPEITFERLLNGLMAFSEEYRGKLWVEVMLVKGLNDTEDALQDIAAALRSIGPDEIHINLPTRPPVETWVQPPDEEGLIRARAILGDIAQIVHPVQGAFELGADEDPVDAVVRIITRHPMSQPELERTLKQWAPGEEPRILKELESNGKAQVVERYGMRFWSAAPSNYPGEAQSQRTAPGAHSRKKEEA